MPNPLKPLRRALAACAILAFAASFAALTSAAPAPAQRQVPPPKPPHVAPASDEAGQAIESFKLPAGFKAELFAAEPRLANPVAFHIDERGRFFVVETYRFKHGVIDIRSFMDWLQDDTAAQKVADRVAMIRKYQGDAGVAALEQYSDRLKLIEDRDGDGRADFDSVFADGHNRIEDGVASGVLARYGDVYYANVPSLYLLKDTDNDGKSDVQKVLHYGYGVRYAYLGHDLHGLRFGPDGKLYFSVGDRGLHIEHSIDGKLLSNPDHGAVLRCNPDGTELELVHVGLRNPQELAFDQYGNLFTGDNNSDGGDQARWVYVVEGGDSGWRVGYQHAEFPVARGPWNSELIWRPDAQTKIPIFYRLPPIVNPPVAGPSGLAYSPGVGLPEKYNDTFFLCDFRGGAAGGSGIYAFRNKPKGATFTVEVEPFATNILPTDVEFGYDGGMYYTDWTSGWELPGKGRIYHLFEPSTAKAPVVAEAAKLMAAGFTQRPADELTKLLAHPDMRVRLEAQYALAGKGAGAVEAFAPVAGAHENQLARIHAIWGLGQVARKSPEAAAPVVPLLNDQDAEVRAQAAKVLGDAKYAGASEGLVKLLADESARVRFFAAMSLGKIGKVGAVPAVLTMLRENNDADPYLRHAGVMALTWIGDVPSIERAAKDESPAVRMAALLAMRRLELPQIAAFLKDRDDRLVLEAARAIYDLPINPALPQLAALAEDPRWSETKALNEAVLVRALTANHRLGTPEAAQRLARYAAGEKGNNAYRVTALNLLGDWAAPKGRDYLTGLWRPLDPRDPAVARDAVQPVFTQLLRTGNSALQIAAADLTHKLGVEDPAVMFELATSPKFDPKVRAAALLALDVGKGDRARLVEAVQSALRDPDEGVRLAAIRLQAKLPGGVERLRPVFDNGSPREKQAAIAALAAVQGPEADAVVSAALDRLLAGQLPPEMHLDLLEAAAARKETNPSIARKLAQFESSRKPETEDPLAPFRETLAGGDAARGEKVFRERADVSCLKCHSVNAQGGNAGPDLAGVGTRATREYLLESIVFPNKHIAPGFETIAVRLRNGTTVSGVLKAEDEQTIQLDVPDKGPVSLKKADIRARRGGLSAMPEGMGLILPKRDLRDLVEYLSGLKSENPRVGK